MNKTRAWDSMAAAPEVGDAPLAVGWAVAARHGRSTGRQLRDTQDDDGEAGDPPPEDE